MPKTTQTITLDSPDRVWIKQARDNDLENLRLGIARLFNCREVATDSEGDIWIADPQTGHWLSAADLETVGRALKRGDI